jgi:hypothetical protein
MPIGLFECCETEAYSVFQLERLIARHLGMNPIERRVVDEILTTLFWAHVMRNHG